MNEIRNLGLLKFGILHYREYIGKKTAETDYYHKEEF